jgi:septal ring factor EnvC (AmiA/AmiB activator)
MSDSPTKEISDSRSFEERVFARFDSLDGRIDSFESRIEAKVDALDGRLTTLEEKVDSRLRETRPLWEAVQARLEGVQNRLEGVENGLEGLKQEVNKLTHTVILVHEDNLHIRANLREMNQRVEKLESQSTR